MGTFDSMRPVTDLIMQTDVEDGCGAEPSWLCEVVYDLTGGSTVLPQLADTLLRILGILIGAWILTMVTRRYFARLVARLIAPDTGAASRQLARVSGTAAELVSDDADPRRSARVRSISAVVGSTAAIIIWSMALILVLGELGVNLAPLIAGAGIAGVALGFGAQSLVEDCIAGLFMLVEDQYGIGDVVDLDEATGVVEKISLRTTVLRGVDGTVWHVPNGEVQRVGNKSQLWSVALVDVEVAYDCDLAAARRVIIDCATDLVQSEDWSSVIIDPPELLGVEALGADGITIRITIKVQPGVQWALQRALREALKTALDGAGIEIPFPQRTVWVRRDDAAGPTAGAPQDDPFGAGT